MSGTKITPAHAQARHDVALLLDAMGTLYGALENLGLLDDPHVEENPDVVQAVAVWTEVAACRNADGTVPDEISDLEIGAADDPHVIAARERLDNERSGS